MRAVEGEDSKGVVYAFEHSFGVVYAERAVGRFAAPGSDDKAAKEAMIGMHKVFGNIFGAVGDTALDEFIQFGIAAHFIGELYLSVNLSILHSADVVFPVTHTASKGRNKSFITHIISLY